MHFIPALPASADGLKAFSFTYVQYDPTDPLGKPLALTALFPIFIMVSYATLIAARRDVYLASVCLGQLLGEAFNLGLKRIVKEPRPTTFLGGDYGMPSSHAQFMAYFATFSVLHLHLRTSYKNPIWKHVLSLGTVLIAGLVAFSRVYLHYHTATQVLAGIQIGTILGLVWYLFSTRILLPFLVDTCKILEHPLCLQFCIRDTSDVGDLTLCEYEGIRKWEQECALRDRSLAGTGVGKSVLESAKKKKMK
ncbi:hypothetical protein CcCBS67573_g04020 [Chytriomyces confervae]|uniref:Dolichyldiphosphatase n=1 Tax=Chytriomyces confervae TaxID=246404 RepID=A0A507FHD4_9FUNG|nr:hypothetical protein CcCBS67573_g04020 [Chytriomyces confervae]